MGGCATKENKENKPADEANGCVYLGGSNLRCENVFFVILPINFYVFLHVAFYSYFHSTFIFSCSL